MLPLSCWPTSWSFPVSGTGTTPSSSPTWQMAAALAWSGAWGPCAWLAGADPGPRRRRQPWRLRQPACSTGGTGDASATLPWTPAPTPTPGATRGPGPRTTRVPGPRRVAGPHPRATAVNPHRGGGPTTFALLTLAGRTAVMGYPGLVEQLRAPTFGRPPRRRPRPSTGAARGDAADLPGGRAAGRPLRGSSFRRARRMGARPAVPPNDAWWAAHYPVLVRAGDITVYDVRRSLSSLPVLDQRRASPRLQRGGR